MVGFKPVKRRQWARGIEKGPRPWPRSNLDFTLLQLFLKKTQKKGCHGRGSRFFLPSLIREKNLSGDEWPLV